MPSTNTDRANTPLKIPAELARALSGVTMPTAERSDLVESAAPMGPPHFPDGAVARVDQVINSTGSRLGYFRELLTELFCHFGSLDRLEGRRILELGATANALDALNLCERYGAQVTGIGADLFYSDRPNLIGVKDYADYLKDRGASFDLILASFSLYHCSGRESIAWALKALRSGALLIRVSGGTEEGITPKQAVEHDATVVRDYKTLHAAGTPAANERRVQVLQKGALPS